MTDEPASGHTKATIVAAIIGGVCVIVAALIGRERIKDQREEYGVELRRIKSVLNERDGQIAAMNSRLSDLQQALQARKDDRPQPITSGDRPQAVPSAMTYVEVPDREILPVKERIPPLATSAIPAPEELSFDGEIGVAKENDLLGVVLDSITVSKRPCRTDDKMETLTGAPVAERSGSVFVGVHFSVATKEAEGLSRIERTAFQLVDRIGGHRFDTVNDVRVTVGYSAHRTNEVACFQIPAMRQTTYEFKISALGLGEPLRFLLETSRPSR